MIHATMQLSNVNTDICAQSQGSGTIPESRLLIRVSAHEGRPWRNVFPHRMLCRMGEISKDIKHMYL